MYGGDYETIAQNSSLKENTKKDSFSGLEKTGCCVGPYFKVTGCKRKPIPVIGAEKLVG